MSTWKLDADTSDPEGSYWASYSDLMAGILLVFAIAATASWVALRQSIVQPTRTLQEWQEFVDAICEDQVLQGDPAIRVDCDTGSLVIQESSLRYPINGVELSSEGRELLERVVPQYLSVVNDYLREAEYVEIESIEVSGHTDSTGTYEANNTIGSARARHAMQFLIEAPSLAPFSEQLRRQGFTAGYTDSRPPEVGQPMGDDWPEARRIEIQVHLDNVSILSDLRDLLTRLVQGP